jgi:uncharacterized membrane-anchored protein
MRSSLPSGFRPGFARATPARPVSGPARLDRCARRLAGRIRPGDVALVDHLDLDRVTAEALVAAGVAAVVNAQPSISGRHPSLGAEVLVRAGIPVVDDLGEVIFQHVRDGELVTVDDTAVLVGEVVVGHGMRQDADRVSSDLIGDWDSWAGGIDEIVDAMRDYVAYDWELLVDGTVPPMRTHLAGRPCVVVTRGYGHREDLEALRPFLRDRSPTLIGVDGGADALLAAGYRPHLIVGDMEAISRRALRCGAELVVRIAPDESGSGLTRLVQLKLPAVVFPGALAAEELAVLLAQAYGASLIVTAGTATTLTELLDRGTGGLASNLVSRLRLGGRVVDATAVALLHRPRVSRRARLAAALAVVAVCSAIWLAMSGGPGLDMATSWWEAGVAAVLDLIR